MTAITAITVLQEKRASRRWDVAVPLEMRGLGTGPSSAQVSDRSPFGCRVLCQRPYHPDAFIRLTRP